ncbi:GerAB/ArcD/ProY family transporter [Salibacterium aidingense]|uniref:GerAB/ArcD/ProY family transporter n=1 Tax=Salibacterium aidingense TaxID=384933 RepID=UPI001E62EE4D|nr:GerAB/ArcD/ProY family transporter [Salibacterium aidingense]
MNNGKDQPMSVKVKEQFQVSPVMAFFLIHAMQVGIGVLGYQQVIAKVSGYDSWISILLAGIMVSILISIIYYLLNHGRDDVIGIHKALFGRWAGDTLSFLFIIYLFILGIVVLRTYIEIVQVWVFEDLPTWVLTILAAYFLYYAVSGGFRAVTGLCVAGVFIPSVIFFILLMPLEYGKFLNLLPLFKTSFDKLMLGARESTLSFLGFELLLLFYPFLKEQRSSQKWAQIGHWTSVFVYVVLMIVTLAFFSEPQLKMTIWPTLTLFKIIEFPFVERFEYLGISIWMVIVAPNIAMTFWAASRGMKRLFPMKQRSAVIILTILTVVVTPLIEDRENIDTFNDIISKIGFWTVLVYIPFLCLCQFLAEKIRKKE